MFIGINEFLPYPSIVNVTKCILHYSASSPKPTLRYKVRLSCEGLVQQYSYGRIKLGILHIALLHLHFKKST